MTDDLKERLLPCPFCGGEAEFALGATGDGKDWLYIECTDCEAVGPRAQSADHGTRIKEALAESWNTRAPDPRITDLEARLAAAEAERDYWQKDSAAAWDKCEEHRLQAVAAEAGEDALAEALLRLSELTPEAANARIARDMYLTVRAISADALAAYEARRKG